MIIEISKTKLEDLLEDIEKNLEEYSKLNEVSYYNKLQKTINFWRNFFFLKGLSLDEIKERDLKTNSDKKTKFIRMAEQDIQKWKRGLQLDESSKDTIQINLFGYIELENVKNNLLLLINNYNGKYE